MNSKFTKFHPLEPFKPFVTPILTSKTYFSSVSLIFSSSRAENPWAMAPGAWWSSGTERTTCSVWGSAKAQLASIADARKPSMAIRIRRGVGLHSISKPGIKEENLWEISARCWQADTNLILKADLRLASSDWLKSKNQSGPVQGRTSSLHSE